MATKRSSLGFGLFIVDRFDSGCLIQHAILIRCQDYRKAPPTADAILSMEEYEGIFQAKLCEKTPEKNPHNCNAQAFQLL
jgi:hypothetical protein